ncbi:MAG: NFACT family protein, partial [Armatimonadota bacterium]
LIINCTTDFGRMHQAEDFEPDSTVNFPAGAVLQRYLYHAVLADVQQREFDRVARLEFANARGMGRNAKCFVIAEIMGRHSNLIITDDGNEIIEAAKHVPAAVNRYRQIQPGLQYVPPPDFDKLAPHSADVSTLAGSASETSSYTRNWFRDTLQGASDIFRDEALARADIEPQRPADELDGGDLGRLLDCLSELLSEACEGRGRIYECPEEQFAYPVSLQCRPDCRSESVDDISAAIDRVARQQISGIELQQLRNRLQQAAADAHELAGKRLKERREALKRGQNAEQLRIIGETLLAHLHEIPDHTQSVTLPNIYDPDESLTIELDPELSPQANAQKYFKRYKKLSGLTERMKPRLAAAKVEQHYLSGLLGQIEQAETIKDLRSIEQEMQQEGYLKKKGEKKGAADEGVTVHSAPLEGNRTLLWGKSGLQNDELLRRANSEDIWLHVKDAPGGHVLIRTDGRPDDVPEEQLRRAAAHAAWLSKQRADTSTEVDYTTAKHVRRLKGTPPGYVHYTHYKTLRVQPRPISAKSSS